MKLTNILTTILLSNLSVWGLSTQPVCAQTGGPDSFGYEYADSNESGCRTIYKDISASGNPLNLSDDGATAVTAPFPITLYGTTSRDLYVGNNGMLVIGTTAGAIPRNNAELPSTTGALANGPSILPFWDDLDDETGNVYTHTLGSAPDRRFIVQWHRRPHYNGATHPDTASFQVVFYENNSRIDFVYNDVDFSNAGWNFGASATIGINQDGSNALQYSFNEASILTGGNRVSAVCFDNSPGSISLEVTVGPDHRTPDNPYGGGCPSEKNYLIRSEDTVTFCYKVTNTSLTTSYTSQDLVSSEFGTLLSGFPFELKPGASVYLNEWKENVTSSFTETATWTAKNTPLTVTSSNSASVIFQEPTCPTLQTDLQKNFYDFEGNNGGGTATNDWEWGVVSPDYPSGLGGAHSGAKAWATVLEGPYTNLDGHNLLSFEIDLTEISGPVGFLWYQVLHAKGSNYDFAKITANGDVVYSTEHGSPDEPEWTPHYADLSSYTGELVTLTFDFYATNIVHDIGWYIDDLSVEYCPQAATSNILKILYYPIISGAAKQNNGK